MKIIKLSYLTTEEEALLAQYETDVLLACSRGKDVNSEIDRVTF